MNDNKQVMQIPIEDIIPNRFQPRISFDEKALDELAKSIKQHGIIQPLVVRKLGDKYEIIAGERRYKAAQIAGLISVPAIVSEMSDQESAEVALIENVQREDLSAIEEARSYKNILDSGEMTQDDLAKKMGLSQSSVANKLRLLNLPEEVQKAVLDGKISERHARSLLQVEDESAQRELLNRVIDERLTVRQLDTIIKEMNNPTDDDVVEDVPLVDMDENLDKIKSEATDINPGFTQNDSDNSGGSHSSKNKFFNFDVKVPTTSDYINPMERPINDENNTFFDFVSSDDSNNLANDLVPDDNIEPSAAPVETDNMTEELLDADEPIIDAESPIIDLDAPVTENIETLDIGNDSIFDDSTGWQPKVDRIKKVVDNLNVNNDLSIEESDTPDYYKVTITIPKDSN